MRLYKTVAKIRPSLLLAVLALPLAVNAQFSPNQSYGPGIQMDALSNITIGPSGLNATQLSYRFRATHTGNLQSVNPYLITDPNAGVSSGKAPCSYACGTGGTLVLQLETDDGSVSHLPSGTVLATASLAHPAQPPLTNPFPAFTFPVPGPSLTSGTIYHLVWSNPAPNGSSNNFVSIDLAWIAAALQNPAMRHEDFSVLELPPGSTTWFELSPGNNSSFTPIINMVYSSGTQGFAYYQNSDRHAIGSTGAVRESFTVTGASRAVVRISVRVRKLAEPTSELRNSF